MTNIGRYHFCVTETLSLTDVEAAARRIAPLINATPLLHSPWLSDLTNGDVWMKVELVQRTGSYKIRGAANAITRLKEQRPDLTAVVTASAGNHGQGVALVAAAIGVHVRVYVPAHAPAAKRNALRRLGAEPSRRPPTRRLKRRRATNRRERARRKAALQPPRHHGGAGTVALWCAARASRSRRVPGAARRRRASRRVRPPRCVVSRRGADRWRRGRGLLLCSRRLAAGAMVLVDVTDTPPTARRQHGSDSGTFPRARSVDRVVAVEEGRLRRRCAS
jgi:hypothetical protein